MVKVLPSVVLRNSGLLSTRKPDLRLLTVLAAVLLAYVILKALYRKNPQLFAKKIRYAAMIAGVTALILLAVTGRLHWLFALLAGLVPLASRIVGLLRIIPLVQSIRSALGGGVGLGAFGPKSGKTSQVQSLYLRMDLDHDSGEVKGEVLQGDFAGRKLETLDLSDLIRLLVQYQQQDRDSALLLQTFLDRRHGPEWRQQFAGGGQTENGQNTASQSSITRAEALEILGLDDSATGKEIVQAHRRLMQRFHPDRGGSNYLAAKINAAKELLLGR